MSEMESHGTPDPRTPSRENDPIPLEPEEQAPPPPRKSSAARIEAPGLLDDFDEDADFESDPELDEVVRGVPVGSRGKPESETAVEESPKPLLARLAGDSAGEPLTPSPKWKVYASLGGVLTVTAAVFAGVYADGPIWAEVLLTLYRAGLHTGTGVAALIITSLLLGRPIGRFESGIAKMLFAVAIFLAVYSLDIPLTRGKLEEILLGAGAYFGGLVLAFRAPPRDAAVIGGAHFGLALIVTLGSMLAAVADPGAAPPP